MDFKHSSGMSNASARGSSENTNNSILRRSRGMQLAAVGASVLAAVAMTACSSGGGGDNGKPNFEQQQNNASGLLFTYPYNGQQDVTLSTQLAVRFADSFSGDVTDAFALRAASGSTIATTAVKDDNQDGIYRITTAEPLEGNTTYSVVAQRKLTAKNTTFNQGDTLYEFTTAPTPGRPGVGDFRVTETSPGETNPVTGRKSVFTQFNTIHVVLSEAINPSTVILGDSFKVTDSSGDEVPGALAVSAHRISFDPTTDLEPGNYTIALTSDVTSQFGKSLDAFSVTRNVLDAGKLSTQNLNVANANGFAGDDNDSILNGLNDNLVTLSTQLIGVNNQPARTSDLRQGVLTQLASPGMPGFNDVIPATIRAGQVLQLKPLSVSLDGAVPTPLASGPIQIQFGSDANVYLMANDLRDIITPTAVRLRFDLNNTTLISATPGTPEYITQALANGVFNQSALNIQVAGLAIPQDNGDLVITTVGTFPLTVSRTDNLVVNLGLTLTLPAGKQTPTQDDTVAPFLTAQVPSACFYTAGTPAYMPTYNSTGASPISLPEQNCLGVLAGGGAAQTQSGITSFPIESQPAITFSEPLNPVTVNSANIQLTGNGADVPATFNTDGDTVVIQPTNFLQPDTQYTITLNGAALQDFGGNGLVANSGNGPKQTITFTTEPLVNTTTPAPVLLGQLSPGLTCAVTGGDFDSGGDNVGHCVGDTPANNEASQDFPVFSSPVNVPVNGYFSKLVNKDSVVLADGCLTPGGNANTVNGATVALEQVDGGGQCVDAVPASLAFSNSNGDMTQGFSIAPVSKLTEGTRYWVVVCGTTRGTPAANCTTQVTDGDDLALNTNPLNGTGSTGANDGDTVQGGPDIVIPFVASAYSTDYYADQFTLPATDTNGNGQFDDDNGNGVYESGDERPQPSNRTLVALTLAGQTISNPNRTDGKYPTYSALNRPVAIRKTLDDCSAISAVTNDDGTSVTGESVDECIQVSLLPGGINDLTGIGISAAAAGNVLPGVIVGLLNQAVTQNPVVAGLPLGQVVPALADVLDTVGDVLNDTTGQLLGSILQGALPELLDSDGNLANTGRLLLRYPNQTSNGEDVGSQSGYIVPECQGTINGQAYDYEPCFVAGLQLVVNAPDGQGVTLAQQQITANVVGPVTFAQNGRLVIPLRNANTVALQATALGLLPSTATINPGDLNLQLAGNENHGGRALPQR